jgi:hypothetical protein
MAELTKEELIKFVQWLKKYRDWVIDSTFLLQSEEAFNKTIEEYIDHYLSGKWREQI